MNNDRSDFRLCMLQRVYMYICVPGVGFVTLFIEDIRAMRKLRHELLIHDHYDEGCTREHDAHGCERVLRRSYIGAGTKHDVNLTRKTLFSLGKVVNGRLGNRPR